MTLKLAIDVPETLAKKARRAGIFERDKFSSMLERELERRKFADEFFQMLEKVHAVPGEPMTDKEIQAEIDASRAERRARRETGR